MINYSIVMRPVNANLFEINAAKGRIKKAIEDGKVPDVADTELVKTEVLKAYAIAQYSDVMNIEKFARHISTHGCVYSRADISAILYLAVDCMREQLLEGKKIRLGDLGDFSINLSSKGAGSTEKFSSQNITGVNVIWEPGMEFKSLLADAEFNLVASRSAQAALLKAIKAGQTVVDITQPETPEDPNDNPSDGSGENPSGGDNTGTGSDSGSGSASGSDSGSDSGSGSGSGSGSSSGGGGSYYE